MADEDVSVGDLTCAYRIHYRSSVALTEEIFAEFSRRNVPLNAWPFLRETVMSVTQRFGWMGLVLPPFKVPAVDTAGFTPPPEKRVAKATPKKRKTLAESSS